MTMYCKDTPRLFGEKPKKVGKEALAFALGGLLLLILLRPLVLSVYASDNFTDIFYTNSFRGAFEWFKKLDWVGMVVQAVISVFALIGVSLIVIRVMTSLLFLSAKGLWEEVHELKSAGGGSERYDFGMVGMLQSWAKGKAGTGLDAIIGAVLILLPDVKRYSDFGEKAGGKFSEDVSVSQYILQIALPTVMSVFFFAMAFNGTLFQALAVTVDAMGSIADKAVSVNYAGMVDDLVNRGSGFDFTYAYQGTQEGKLKQRLAKDIYGRAVSNYREADPADLQQIGLNVENIIETEWETWITEGKIDQTVREGLDVDDAFYTYIGHQLEENASEAGGGAIAMTRILEGVATPTDDYARYLHVYIRQTDTFAGRFINTGE